MKFIQRVFIRIYIATLLFKWVGSSTPFPNIGVWMPDPLTFPDEYEFSNFFCTMKASDNEILGLSGLQLEYLSANLNDLSVDVGAKVPLVSILGNATLTTGIMFSSSSQYNITFSNMSLGLIGQVLLGHRGTLEMSKDEIKLQTTYEEVQVDIEDLPWIPNYVYELVIDQLMPKLQDQVRHHIKGSALDPLSFDDNEIEVDLGHLFQCTDVTLEGLSSLYLADNGIFSYIEDTFQLSFQVRTQTLKIGGICGMIFVPMLESSLEILADYVEITIEIHLQSRLINPPTLRLLEFDIGNIETKVSGLGSASYIAEAVLDIVQNLSRDQIQKRMQKDFWKLLQSQLNKLDPSLMIHGYMKQEDTTPQKSTECTAAFRGERCNFLNLSSVTY
ncbi:uncharacterized protein [Palaemon carinicauda]|uniref:uncharacterized protein isoform X2 n=1 Tax=Palaemon carinicauda TaxID=392227 RepID=UPI0035B5B718